MCASAIRVVDRIVDMADSNIQNPLDGQFLSYDQATSKWINRSGGNGQAFNQIFSIADWILDNPTNQYYITINHNLGSTSIIPLIWNTDTKQYVILDIERTNTNSVKIFVSSNPDNRINGDIIIVSSTGASGTSGYSGYSGISSPSYYATFNNASDWTLDNPNDQYYINFQHDLNSTNIVVTIWDTITKRYVIPDIEKVDLNNVKIFVSANPDNRFQGEIDVNGGGLSGYSGIIGGSGYSGESGTSGYSGYSGESGIGISGESGYSGYSGEGSSGYSGFSGQASNDTVNLFSTGIITGGELSVDPNDNTKFVINAGTGLVVNNYSDPLNPTKTLASWITQSLLTTPYLATEDVTYVNMDSLGSIVFTLAPPTEEERRDLIVIGWLDHTSRTQIDDAKTEPFYTPDILAQLNDFFENFGSFNVDGNVYTYSAGMTIKRTAGKTFDGNANYASSKKNPHILTTDIEDPASIHYYYREYPIYGGWINNVPETNNVDPNHYDDNSGSLADVPSGKWTIQIIAYYANTQSNDIQYGQVVYDDYASAKSALQDPVAINPYNSYDTFRGWLIVKQGATDLSNANEAVFISAGKLGLFDVASGGGTGGEINTASNVGLSGVGTYYNKVGVDLRFKNIAPASNKITVVNNAGNKTIDIDVDIATIAHSGLSGLSYDLAGHTDFGRTPYEAISNPLPSNDGVNTVGTARPFRNGDLWLNTSSKIMYICVDNTTNAAVWVGYAGYSGVSGYSGYSGIGISGYSGYSGTNGSIGVDGTPGDITGLWVYNGNTPLSPEAGEIQLDSATPSSITTIRVNSFDANSIIQDAWIDSWANGNPIYGSLTLRVGNTFANYTVSAISSGFGGRTFTVSYVSTNISSFNVIDNVVITFARAGVSGYSGYSGTSGRSGYSGYSGISGYSGYSGTSGRSGYSGYSGVSGTSGYSGYSGVGTSGYSGYSGLVADQNLLYNVAGTGVVAGGIISTTDTDSFDISDGTGYIIDNTNGVSPVVTKVVWTGKTNISDVFLFTHPRTYVFIDSAGNVVQDTAPPDSVKLRTHLYIGRTVHTNLSTITVTTAEPALILDQASYLHDLYFAIGSLNVDGNVVSANAVPGSNLKIDRTSGNTFRLNANVTGTNGLRDPNITVDSGATQQTFRYEYRNGSGGFTISGFTSDVNPNQYDDGTGVLATVPAGNWTIQRIYLAARASGTPNIYFFYGQATYATFDAAFNGISTESVSVDPAAAEFTLRSYLIVKQGTTNLASTDNQFVIGGKFGGGGGGSAGLPGASGTSGCSGYSGVSGSGVSGYSGYSGLGLSGYSGASGTSGYSGYSGVSGTSGYSGYSGVSGTSGYSGYSGYSGVLGDSGYSGYSGFGISGYSGYSGISPSGVTQSFVIAMAVAMG